MSLALYHNSSWWSLPKTCRLHPDLSLKFTGKAKFSTLCTNQGILITVMNLSTYRKLRKRSSSNPTQHKQCSAGALTILRYTADWSRFRKIQRFSSSHCSWLRLSWQLQKTERITTKTTKLSTNGTTHRLVRMAMPKESLDFRLHVPQATTRVKRWRSCFLNSKWRLWRKRIWMKASST